MAKKFNKRAKNKLMKWMTIIIGLVISVGIGGLFVNGTFTNVVILNWLPLIVHQVVGWVVIASAILTFVLSLLK